MRPIKKGSTDQSVIVRVIDSSDGTPETSVAYDTAGVDLWYRREGGASVDITEATLAAVNSAHSPGGFIHINDGYCRLDLPDAAVETGANGVMVGGTFTGMIVIGTYIPLVDYDPYDTVRMGMTALPNAAADAAGGLPISDAGGLDLDTLNSNVSDIQTQVGTDGDGLTALPWNAAWDAEVQSEVQDAIEANNLDHLCKTATAAADMTTEVVDNSIISRILANGDTSAFDPSTDGLQPLRDHIGDGTNLTEAGGTGDHLTAVVWNADWDAEVQSECTDALNAYDPPTKAELDSGLAGLNDIAAADVWSATNATTSLAYSALMARAYEMINNKMTVNETTGAVALRNIGDTADIATGNVASSSGTTTRAELTWA